MHCITKYSLDILSICGKIFTFVFQNTKKILFYGCLVLLCLICWFYYYLKYDLIKIWPLVILMAIIFCLYSCFKKPINKDLKGLRNAGEFCYMNAMVQALASSTEIVNQFIQLKKNVSNNCSKLEKFIDLLQSVNDHQSDIDSNSNKLSSLIQEINWNKSSQQDAFDLLSALVNSIHRDIKAQLVSREIQMPLKIKLLHQFKGVVMTNKIQDHLGLSIGLCGNYSEYPGESLEHLINEHFSPTLIDDDPDKTTQMLFYEDFPKVLLLHVQANKWDAERGEMIKPKYHIRYQDDLLLDLEIATNSTRHIKKKCRYEIRAIVEHMGTISGGHYVAYRRWNSKWYLVNDGQVEEMAFNNNVCPYILIYEKVYHYSIPMSKTNNG